MKNLSNGEIASAHLSDWRKLAQALHARYIVPDYRAVARFLADLADVVESQNHHPEIRVSYGVVDISICTHEGGRWVTDADVELARRISEIALEHKLEARPTEVRQLELALDTANEGLISNFWAVILTDDRDTKVSDTIFDSSERVPNVWFQTTNEHEEPMQRWHFDLWCAPEVAERKIREALEAGGVLVDDSHAPSFSILSDSDGNKVCICTSEDR